MSQFLDPNTASLNPGKTEKRVSQYEDLMRKFSAAHKKECRRGVSIDIPKVHRSEKQFPTGSTYEGTWDVLGMSGTGVYTYPNGVIYRGEFDDGMFHGDGKLQYPSGVIISGKFRRGVMVEQTLMFPDGLEYSDTDWKYCKKPDRRFSAEYDEGLKPAGKSNLTADLPPRKIPNGFYDAGDGFFDPTTKAVYKADDLTAIIRYPGEEERWWILENCRSATVDNLGPRPDLYEKWVEPEVNPPSPPQPAAVTKGTAHLFESGSGHEESSVLDEDEDSDVVVVEDWMKVLKTESVSSNVSRRLRFHPSITQVQVDIPKEGSQMSLPCHGSHGTTHTKFLNLSIS